MIATRLNHLQNGIKMMLMKKFPMALLSVLWLITPLTGLVASDAKTPALNLLFLITDQQTVGALSCAGNPYVKTPHVDALAARGVRFEKSYCTYPLCCPSRGSLFTSRTPHELGIYYNDVNADLSRKNVPTMGGLFQTAGYDTAYAGKWHLLAPFPSYYSKPIPGFEVLPLAGVDPSQLDLAVVGKGLTVDPHTADAAIAFLGRSPRQPFLLAVSLVNPHDICEYPESAVLRKLLPADSKELPPAPANGRDSMRLPTAIMELKGPLRQYPEWTDQQWREYLWVYYRLIESADAEVGRVLAALDQARLASNTLVVFTSDHGDMLGAHGFRHKQKLYEEAVTVPLIVAVPGGRSGVDHRHLISGLDILPTMLDYAGLGAPGSLQGRSLRPLIEDKPVAWREFVASEVNIYNESRMIRSARYKYIVYAQGSDREQLFDLEQDPGELRNRIADPAYADEVARHRQWMDQWRKETHDDPGAIGSPKKKPNERKKVISPANAQKG